MNTISLKMPKKLHGRLVRASKVQAVSKSEFVRRAVERALDEAQIPTQKPSLLELAGELLGSVRFGPPALSTDPKYLAGYGKDRRP